MSQPRIWAPAKNSPSGSPLPPVLTEEEIERMTKDAELHAEEDKKRKELVEARNQADALDPCDREEPEGTW